MQCQPEAVINRGSGQFACSEPWPKSSEQLHAYISCNHLCIAKEALQGFNKIVINTGLNIDNYADRYDQKNQQYYRTRFFANTKIFKTMHWLTRFHYVALALLGWPALPSR